MDKPMRYTALAEMRTAFEAGYDAFAKNAECPYAESSDLAYAWRSGWNQAASDLVEQIPMLRS